MITSTRIATTEQARSIVHEHVAAIAPFLNGGSESDDRIADVCDWLEALSDVERVAPEHSTLELYEQTATCLEKLDDFLELMGQRTDSIFDETPIGMIRSRAEAWRELARQKHDRFTRDQIWDWLAPAIPDCLEDLGNNIFEAKWAAPVPAMDLEIFRRTEGVEILGDSIEPKEMPDGIAFRFKVSRERARH